MSKNEYQEVAEQHHAGIRLLVSAALLITAAAADRLLPGQSDQGTVLWFIRLALYLVPYLLAGIPVLKEAAEGLFHGELLDENFLMAAATIGAFFLGEYAEAVFVMLFSQTGEFFEEYAEGRSRTSIEGLLKLRPATAFVEAGGVITEKQLEDVHTGDIVTVRPGERIPVDGEIIEGITTLDTAALTGESLPRDAGPGSVVLSGCMNLTGFIKIRVTKEAEDSTISKILELVENAGERKAPQEKFITRFARIYTPAVVSAAVLMAVIPPLLLNASWHDWVYRALSFLVISCPCALVISIPLGFFGGIGAASRMGILIKGSSCIDTLARLGTAVFDKTGTLTKGVFSVQALHGDDTDQLLELAAHAESRSTHPVALAIVEAWQNPEGQAPRLIDESRLGAVSEKAGQGVVAEIDGHTVCCGNEKLMNAEGITTAAHPSATTVHVSLDGAYLGCIEAADTVKETARQAVSELKALGVSKVVMLTGDTKAAAETAARSLGIEDVRSALMPQDKVACLEGLIQEAGAAPGKKTVAFTGDGINDAPVLMRADAGIAMGALGSDAAIEAADVVIMDDNPEKLADAVWLSRKTMAIVRENIWFALAVKGAVLGFSAAGISGMWAAVFADVGVSILAILNAMRAGQTRRKCRKSAQG